MAQHEPPRRPGTVTRAELRRHQPSSDPRIAWLLVLVALVVGAGAAVWLLGPATIGSTPHGGPTIAPTAPSTPEPSPTVERSPTSTVEPSPSTTPTPSSASSPSSTPAPSTDAPPSDGLIIDFPAHGELVRSRSIKVIGTGPPGATITRDIPLWFDDHTTVRDDGIWMMPVQLSPGGNHLTFRIGDDRSTEVRIIVTYDPR